MDRLNSLRSRVKPSRLNKNLTNIPSACKSQRKYKSIERKISQSNLINLGIMTSIVKACTSFAKYISIILELLVVFVSFGRCISLFMD